MRTKDWKTLRPLETLGKEDDGPVVAPGSQRSKASKRAMERVSKRVEEVFLLSICNFIFIF